MISVTAVTNKYILQPSLLDKHRKSLEWLSAIVLWKRELVFFQKLLDQHASRFTSVEQKKQIDHVQSIITYYKGELLDSFATRLRLHEKKLAEMFEFHDETQTEYFTEHEGLMGELQAVNDQFVQYKEELFKLIEQVM